jgi:hypothetical protein
MGSRQNSSGWAVTGRATRLKSTEMDLRVHRRAATVIRHLAGSAHRPRLAQFSCVATHDFTLRSAFLTLIYGACAGGAAQALRRRCR